MHKVDPVQDSKLAKHVLGNHVRNHPEYDPELPEHAHLPAPEEEDDEILSQDQLRKYVTFAKQSCRPRMTQAHEEKIAALKEALMNGEMGPAVFDKHYQEVWLKMKAEEQEQYRKGQRSYTADDD